MQNQRRIEGNLEASEENSVELALKSSEKANEFQKVRYTEPIKDSIIRVVILVQLKWETCN